MSSAEAAGAGVPTTEVKFKVGMTCSGCEGAVKRILGKLEGVSSIATDVGAKSVVVSLAQGSPTTKEALLEALQKWGKAAAKSVELDE